MNIRPPSQSIAELMATEQIPNDVREQILTTMSGCQISRHLAVFRHNAKITQSQMAERLNVSQPTISKIESGKDDDLLLKVLHTYSQATGARFVVSFGTPPSPKEAVKYHALELKENLDLLAEAASRNPRLQRIIRSFCEKTFLDLFKIMADCNARLAPTKKTSEPRLEVFEDCPQEPAELAAG